MKIIPVIIIVFCSYFSQQATAFSFGITIPERQLNTIVNLRFPLSQTYMNYSIKALQPSLVLDANTQSVAISVRINALDTNHKLTADATFKGQIAFDKPTNSLKIINPLMTQFTVIDNTFPSSVAPIDSIKNAVGQHLPIAILIDFNQIDKELFHFSPANLFIVEGGLRMEF